ncbi:hypothetical protein N7474_007435 [Penicillium riverlandense]|uniref:uncharacterized protein n=1 Tax=Penicillium riverlandense TaxID=1903569 RepID=UPI0025480730|nr:uncharacterized protein N7474_007435 [Penicillium riverlandense]KAJ5815658.1 hypothetical protein N7474_007435 [Penicillium riverlandense]
MVGKSKRAKNVVDERLPPLKRGPKSTTSSALHQIKYAGRLEQWITFQKEVTEAVNQQEWHQHPGIVGYGPSGQPGHHNVAHEQVCVGDETGVQGRFQQNVGQAMSAVFSSQSYDLRFADFKCSASSYSRTPDSIIMDSQGSIKAVGELKAPWVPDHQVNKLMTLIMMVYLKRAIGQLARYMKELHVKYGFFSIYDCHVFFKQELVNGNWTLFLFRSCQRSGH